MKIKILLQVAGLWTVWSALSIAQAQPIALVTTNTLWRYIDNGSNQGTAWRTPDFNDSGWSNGPALFGIDTPGIWPLVFRTPMPVSTNRITYYFRTHFTWSGGVSGATLISSNYIDDGAVFYLNGTEAGRVRITDNPVLFDSLALNQGSEGSVDVVSLAVSNLVSGDNVLAVEVHQFTTTSSDIVWGMTLGGVPGCTAPNITCPANRTTNVCGGNPVVTFANPTVSGGALMGCVPASGSVFPQGTNVVTCTATNACGANTCSFTVTVGQVAAAALTCRGDLTTNICSGTSAPAFFGNPTGVVGQFRGCVPPSGSVFSLGTTPVICTVTNRCSTNTCTFNVVMGIAPVPVLSCSPGVTNRTCNTSATVTFPTPTVTSGQLLGCVPASGSVFPLGTTSVTCTGSNRCFTSTCTFTVVVEPRPPLILVCPGNITTNITGTNVVVNYANATVTNGTFRGCTPASGSLFPIGTTPVSCIGTNVCGTNTCTFNVSVQEISTNCLYFAGLEHCRLGNATLNLQSDQLEVSNIGNSSTDGVIISGGDAQGMSAEIHNLNFDDTNSTLRATMRGTLNGTTNFPVGTLKLTPVGSNLVLSADYSPVGSTSYTVEVWSRGVMVARQTNVAGNLATIGQPVGQNFIVIIIIIIILVCIPLSAGITVGPHVITIGAGLWTGVGDEIRVIPENQASPVPLMQSMSLQGTHLSPLIIVDETLKKFDMDHRALGRATFQAQAERLTVGNLGSSGEDGVEMALGRATEFVWTVDLLSPPLGAQFVTRYFGLVNGVANSSLGSSTMTSVSAGAQILPDFSGLGSSTYELQLLLNNAVVYTESGKTGIAMVVGGAAARGKICWFRTGICSYHFGITAASEPHDVFVTGGPRITADMFVITPESPTKQGAYVGSCEATATLIPSFVILDEAVPAPPVITCPANITTNILGSSVVVNYPGPTVSNGSLLGCTTASGSLFSLGTTVITCTATNAYGSKTCAFNVTVQYITPPRIIAQPQSRTAAPGNDVTISVAATGTPPLQYQWIFCPQPNWNQPTNVLTVTGAMLTLHNVQPTNAGDYLVVVSNPSGSVTSSPAMLTLLPGPSRLRANSDSLWAVTDKPLTLHDQALLANDTNGYALVVTLMSVSPVTSHGGTVIRNGQTFTYRSSSGFAGTDSFTYTISDGTTTSIAIATVEVSRSEGRGNITSIVHRDSSVEINFDGIPNRLYSLRRASSLPNNSTSLWQRIAFVATSSNGNFSYLDVNPSSPKAFYDVCDPCFPCTTDEATVEQLNDPDVEVILSPVGFIAHRLFKIQNASIVKAGGNVPTDTYAVSKVDSLGVETPVPVPYSIAANGDITVDLTGWPDGKYYFSLESTVMPCQEEEGQNDAESDYDVVEIRLAAPGADFSCTQKYPCDPFNIQFDVINPDFSSTYIWHIFDEDGDELPIGSATGPALCFTLPYISIAPHFRVCLDVVDFLGQTNCHCKVVTVSTDPDPSFTFTYDACRNEPIFSVVFENTSKPTGCLDATYEWTFGNNIAPPTSTAFSPTHSYAPGGYSVTLKMTLNGVTKSVTKNINVHADAIYATATVCGDGHIIYRTPNGNPPHWSFNDGDADILNSIEHNQRVKYTLVGTKHTSLTFTNSDFGVCTTNLTPVIQNIIECCNKDHQIDHFVFSDNGETYRLKTTWKCRGASCKITAKTRIAIKTGQIGNTDIFLSSWPWIKRKDVKDIEVSWQGLLFFTDPTTDCFCAIPSLTSESKSVSKKRHVTKRMSFAHGFRIRHGSISATHSVTLKNGSSSGHSVSFNHFSVCNDD